MTSQRVERTWIRTGGYGRFRGEWVKYVSEISTYSFSGMLKFKSVVFILSYFLLCFLSFSDTKLTRRDVLVDKPPMILGVKSMQKDAAYTQVFKVV